MILIAGTTTDADRPYNLAIRFNGIPSATIMTVPLLET
jgi:hypothetical protein